VVVYRELPKICLGSFDLQRRENVFMRRFFWTISKYVFFFLIALLIIGVGAAILIPNFTPAREGCYWTSAMIGYIACPKVPAGQLIAFVLNLPFRVFMYAPSFAVYDLFSEHFFC
jgi:hypothetical protein